MTAHPHEGEGDGGPAFARPMSFTAAGQLADGGANGMSLRDYFAGQIVVGLFADARLGGMTASDRRKVFDEVAARVYEVADAMLRARRTP